MGDPYPVARTGITRVDGGLVVVNAVCPGERLVDVTLSRQRTVGEPVVLWHIAGDAALPAQVPVGSQPTGMRTVTSLVEPLDGPASLLLSVETDELDTPTPMAFEVGDVPTGEVWSFSTVYPNVDAFTRAALADTPCGDPYSKNGVGRFAVIVMLCGAGAGALGVTCCGWPGGGAGCNRDGIEVFRPG